MSWIRRHVRAGSRPGKAAAAAGLACTAVLALGAFAAPAGVTYTVVPLPSGGTELHGVSASSSSDAWAVGFGCCRPRNFGEGTLAEHWNGTAWSITPSQDFYRFDDVLNAVADVSPANAWAVGSLRAFASSTPTPLILHWNGSSWQGGGAPAGLTGMLRAVSGDSPGDLWAVGDDAHGHAVALRFDGTAWAQTALPAAGASGTLAGVKAFGPADVWAVGSTAGARTLVLHWNGTAWSVVPSPNPDPNADSLLAVGGVTGNDLWAVGQQGAGTPGTRTLAEHWNGTGWSVVASPNAGGQDTLTGVAASGPTAVAAVGSFQTSNGTAPVRQTLALEWNGTSWVIQQTPNAGNDGSQLLGAAAVPGTGTVWAAGFSTSKTPSGFTGNQPLLLKGVSG